MNRKQEGATATRENLLGQKSGRLQATKNFKKHCLGPQSTHMHAHPRDLLPADTREGQEAPFQRAL